MKKITALLLALIITLSVLTSCTTGFEDFFDITPGYYTYTDFTLTEREIFLTYIGEVIPFAPTDKYKIIETNEGESYGEGIRYYTVGNTKEDFESYRLLFSDYTLDETNSDGDGNLWYHYYKGNIGVSMSYYTYNSNRFIDVAVYYLYRSPISTGTLSNKGLGLPDDEDGVHEINFYDSNYLVDVTDMDKYLNGCPTTGSPSVLVIPVEFPDVKAQSKGYSIEKLKRIFNGSTGETDYYSVDEYYKISSYGQLDLDITVLDSWFTAEHQSSYYKNQTMEYQGEDILIGDQIILNEALGYLDDSMDLSRFDSDGNGTIDAVIMVSTLSVDSDEQLQWAYRYWNLYDDLDGEPFEYDGVYAQDYIWMCYSFMHEKVSLSGKVSYSDTSLMNPQTFIHEFGHILGAEDYYDTSYHDYNGPTKGLDVMDSTLGDHSPYTKFAYGWITETRLVTSEKAITLTLTPFNETGDTIIIANNWDDALGAFQEYFVLMYYKTTGLNDGKGGYFSEDGIVVYHINSTLSYDEYLPRTFYGLENDNRSHSSGGTANNLVELVPCKSSILGTRTYIFTEGKSLSTVFDDSGNLLLYTFKVDSLTEDEATITFNLR